MPTRVRGTPAKSWSSSRARSSCCAVAGELRATYRLQLTPEFGFRAARELVPYLTALPRRFSDISDRAGVRVEDEAVFETTHAKAFELVRDGVVDGLRIDHVDGLANPRESLSRLARAGVGHVWVEKILEAGERLRP